MKTQISITNWEKNNPKDLAEWVKQYITSNVNKNYLKTIKSSPFIWFKEKKTPESSVRGMNFPINNLNQTYNI